MRCGPVQLLVPAFVSLSVMRLCCANMAEWIEVLLGVEGLGNPRWAKEHGIG